MRQILYLAIFMFLISFSNSYATEKQLHIGISTGYPPFYFFTEDQQPTGICIDTVRQVAKTMGYTVKFTSYPWKRMLSYGKNGTVDAIMPLFQTPKREQFLIFPKSALIDEDNRFFTAASNRLDFSGKLADVIQHKIAVVDGFSYGAEFDQTEFTNKTTVQTTEQLILLVANKRVDLGIGNSKVIRHQAREMNNGDSLRFLEPPVTVEPLFIGFSKQNIDEDFVDRFNRQLEKFKQTPAYQKVIETYDRL